MAWRGTRIVSLQASFRARFRRKWNHANETPATSSNQATIAQAHRQGAVYNSTPPRKSISLCTLAPDAH